MPFRHILVPLDFSEPALRALRTAVGMARHGKARLTLLHAIIPHVSALAADVPGWAAFDPDLIQRYQQELETAAKHALERAARDEIPDDVPFELAVITGPVADTVNDQAKRRGADLICLGTTGRTGLPHLLLGSVAGRVVARAPVPVLVCH